MNIIIYGNSDDTGLEDVIFKTLSRYGNVQFLSQNKLICSRINENSTSERNFFIYDFKKIPEVIHSEGLFIFKKSFKKLNLTTFPANFLTIIDEQNINAIKCLEKTNQIVVTCGTSSKNTLSFSSFSHSEAVVVLQRYLQSKHKIIEPHEFVINFNETFNPNILLITCAILLLSDVPSTNGYKI